MGILGEMVSFRTVIPVNEKFIQIKYLFPYWALITTENGVADKVTFICTKAVACANYVGVHCLVYTRASHDKAGGGLESGPDS